MIGNGMAGIACLEEVFKFSPSFEVTILSEEPHLNYNRILLSSVLAGEKEINQIYLNPQSWYDQHKINLKLGVKAVQIDMAKKIVIGSDGSVTPFDKILFANALDLALFPHRQSPLPPAAKYPRPHGQ